MSTINFNAQQLVQSQSHNAPFMVIFESDQDLSVVYAVIPKESDATIVDQYVFDDVVSVDQLVIRWNAAGDRAGIIIKERVELVFDFKATVTYSDHQVPTVETSWARQQFQFSNDIAIEFGIDQFFKQPSLDSAIEVLSEDGSQTNRLLFYKELLTSVIFVPITTDSPDDPNALIYTFPNPSDSHLDNDGNLICSFTNSDIFNQQMGQFGLSFQKVSADFLCFQAKSFDDILGITITSSSGRSVLITRDEFQLLALISQPQRLNTQELLKELGDVFFTDVIDERRDGMKDYFLSTFKEHQLVRSAYYTQPNVNGANPILLVLTSTNASDALSELVLELNKAPFHDQCDCHVFSLSDIVAQSLEQSKQPL